MTPLDVIAPLMAALCMLQAMTLHQLLFQPDFASSRRKLAFSIFLLLTAAAIFLRV